MGAVIMRGPCPAECPQRRVGCREGCAIWAEHERRKAERYRARQQERETWRPGRGWQEAERRHGR